MLLHVRLSVQWKHQVPVVAGSVDSLLYVIGYAMIFRQGERWLIAWYV